MQSGAEGADCSESHGLMFHHFWDDRHPQGQGAISADQLSDIIEFVGQERILPAKDWSARALSGRLAPGELCLTFDDALRSQLDVALPVLDHYGLTAFWFVYSAVFQGQAEGLEIYRHFRDTAFESIEAFYQAFDAILAESKHSAEVAAGLEGFRPSDYLADYPFYTDGDRRFRYIRDHVLGLDRYGRVMDLMLVQHGFDIDAAKAQLWMREGDLLDLARAGHVVGAHSYSHPTRMEDLSLDRQEDEYGRNLDHLEALLGSKPVVMAHPCGSYTEATLALLSDLGIRLGFRSNMAQQGGGSQLEWPREDHANILRIMDKRRVYA